MQDKVNKSFYLKNDFTWNLIYIDDCYEIKDIFK